MCAASIVFLFFYCKYKLHYILHKLPRFSILQDFSTTELFFPKIPTVAQLFRILFLLAHTLALFHELLERQISKAL